MASSRMIRAHAAENALAFGKADAKSVLGKVLAEDPSLRKDAAKTLKEVEKIVVEVNSMSNAELEKAAASRTAKKPAEARRGPLPELPNAKGQVVMRFAPNPSGYLHIGHARTAIMNDEYVKKYDGRFILRIEDTDPGRVDKDAYRTIEEDLKWLGITIHEVVLQSARLAVYRDFAVRLMEQGNAYVCSCGQEKFKELKDAGKECPCRKNAIEKNLELWEKMLGGDDSLVLNLKTDIKHRNPALRDFPIMRVSKERHPLTGRDVDIYPLMNFSVAIDDHLLGVTHVLRGSDHLINTERQKFLYNYLKWKPPEIIHHGLLNIVGIELSKSVIKQAIEEGKYEDWSDPRLGTLRALRKRGIEPDAIRASMKAIGIGDVDATFDWKNLYAENRKIIEPKANRYFFVPDPVEVWVSGLPAEADVIRVPLHPGYPQRGYRDIVVEKNAGITKIFVPEKDAGKLKKGDIIRLKNFCNIQIDEARPMKAHYMEGKDTKVPIIQWLPNENMGCEVIGPDKRTAGFCEIDCKNLDSGDLIQFERFGFCKVAQVEGNDLICYFAHD